MRKFTSAARLFAALCLTSSAATAQTLWADWTSADPPGAGQETAVGMLGNVAVTFTGELGLSAVVSSTSSYWTNGSSTYTSANVAAPPPNGDILRLVGGASTGTQTLTFSRPVDDPVLAVLSLGQFSLPATYDFDTPFVLENFGQGHWGNGTLTALAGDVLEGREGHGIIRFPGTHTQITFTMPTAESWHGITVAIDETLGARVCSPAVANSTGWPASVYVHGSTLASDNDVLLVATSLPLNSFGYFITSQTAGLVMNAGGSQGTLCLGGTIGRYDALVQSSGTSAQNIVTPDLPNTPSPTGLVSINAGQTWIFQCWYRDSASGGSTSNFTDAVSVGFQ